MKKIAFFLIFFVTVSAPAFCADYVYKKLNSGQTVIVKEVRDNPIVTINTWVKTGSVNEDDTNSGVAHFLEHLFFKGSKNVPTGQFDRLLESKGGVTNAATGKDYTQFYITIPSSEFDLALKLHSDMLLNPLIPSVELEKERAVVIEEIARGNDNPLQVVYNNLFNLIYTSNNNTHPYKRPVIGTKEVISTIPKERILEFYNKWYIPENMITIVSGDVDADYAIKEISKAFPSDKKNKIKSEKHSRPAIYPISSPLVRNEIKDTAQGYMAIACKAPKYENSKDAFALDILSIILGGSNSSVLNTELKEKNRLVNSISASYSQYLDDGLFIIITSFEASKKPSLIKEAILSEIEKAKKGEISNEQIQKAKNMLKSSTDYSRESAANIANELGYFTLYYGSPKMYDTYLKEINKITKEDVIKAANKYLIFDKSATATVLPPATSEISCSFAAKINREDKKESVKPLETNGAESKYVLDNGAVLILRKNKSNSIVAIDILAKGGSFLSEKPGVSYLAAVNSIRGTKSYNYQELNDFLDENGIELSVISNPDAFNISLKTTKEKLGESLGLLNEVVNFPSFNKDEISKTVANYKEYVNSMKDKPLSLALDELTGAAFSGYPYSNNAKKTVEYIDLITRDEITSFYNKILDPKNLIIAVTGDIEPESVISEFNSIFKDRGQKKVEIKDFYKESYIPQDNAVTRIPNTGKETSWILVAYKTSPVYDLKDLATLKVIDSILGTGMSSRLFTSLREAKGLAYQVGSQINQYANDGVFFAYIGTNSKNEQTALDGILYEFERLKREFVPEKELREAKDKLLGNMVIALETNMDRSSFLSKYGAFGYDLNFLDNLKKEIENVSASDILSYANKYFANPRFQITVGN